MVSWFPAVTHEEILAVFEAAISPTPRKLGLALFSSTLLMWLAVRLSANKRHKTIFLQLQFTTTPTKQLK